MQFIKVHAIQPYTCNSLLWILYEILVLGFMCNSSEHSIQIEYQINLTDSWRDWYKRATLATCSYISPCTPKYSKRKRVNWVYSRQTFHSKNIKPLNIVPPKMSISKNIKPLNIVPPKMSITKLSVLSSNFYCKNIKPLNFVPPKILLTKLTVLSWAYLFQWKPNNLYVYECMDTGKT
jgi:hypothetical protein